MKMPKYAALGEVYRLAHDPHSAPEDRADALILLAKGSAEDQAEARFYAALAAVDAVRKRLGEESEESTELQAALEEMHQAHAEIECLRQRAIDSPPDARAWEDTAGAAACHIAHRASEGMPEGFYLSPALRDFLTIASKGDPAQCVPLMSELGQYITLRLDKENTETWLARDLA